MDTPALLPDVVDAAFIEGQLVDQRDELFEEGDLVPNRVARFRHYRLCRLPLNDLEPGTREEHVAPSLVADYASQPADTAPPIIVDSIDRAIIDGFHRFNAALARGETDILAYVGEDPDPTWIPHEDHPYPIRSMRRKGARP